MTKLITQNKDGETQGLNVLYGDISNGYELYIEGAEFPLKGKPAGGELLYGLGILKSTIVEFIRNFGPLNAIPLLISREKYLNKLLKSFNLVANRALDKHRLETNHMSPFSRELEQTTTIFLMELGVETQIGNLEKMQAYQFARNLSQIFEYDSSYRWRMQDLFSATNKKAILNNPRKELLRLGELAFERDDIGNKKNMRLGKRMKRVMKIASLILLIPRINKAFKQIIDMANFANLRLDDPDRYWAYFKLDYNFDGKTPEERLQYIIDKGWKIPISSPLT